MHITAPSSNLGDNLWITPLFRYCNYPIKMLDEKRNRDISAIYQGLTNVSFEPNLQYHSLNKSVHNTKQVFSQVNLNYIGRDLIPWIVLSSEEISWAVKFLEQYPNPIVMINDNSGSSGLSNIRSQIILPPRNIIQAIANHLSKKFSILQFGLNEDFYRPGYSNFTPIKGAYYIRGLQVRQLAACYHVIGKYIGGDTGDYHLMTAVGGQSIILIPRENETIGYIYSNLLYSKDMWNNKQQRVQYIHYTDLGSIDIAINNL